MAIWLFRAGRNGEFENKFLSDEKVYLTWADLKLDLSKIDDKTDLSKHLNQFYDKEKKNTIRNWTGQIWPIAKEVQKGDWVVLPSKMKSAIHIGEVTGEYTFDAKAENPFFHFRTVNWFAQDLPRTNFDQDILYSFGAFMTVCRINRNDAESRIKAMAKNKWQSIKLTSMKPAEGKTTSEDSLEEVDTESDLELLAKDQIAKYLIRNYKGHGMAIIVDAILRAKGYTTYRSPEGADKGVDILAAPEPMGFGNPRLCVQIKTGDTPLDRPTLDQLIGTMSNFKADQGLLVSWSGFKNSVDREIPNQFFKVRLWDQQEIIRELLHNYDRLDDDIKAELPLKRIWALAIVED